MYEHFIIMASSYEKGTRIAIDYPAEGSVNADKMREIVTKIGKECGNDVSFSTHFVTTSGRSWKSVVQYDPFFEDVYYVKVLDEFISLIKNDLVLHGIDVARYILSKRQCTHLELEKLVYLCYADYLCKNKARLFEDKIYAFKYGPVVHTVYEMYKHKKGKLRKGAEEMISKSRFMILPDGLTRVEAIDDTLRRYEKCGARDLVAITHADSSPWSMKDYRIDYQQIEDALILKYHKKEEEYFKRTYI